MADTKVREVMASDVVTVTPETSIHDAAALLAEHKISGAPVVAQGAVVGMVSEADLLAAAMPPSSRHRGVSVLDMLSVIGTARPRGHHDGLSIRDVMSQVVVAVHPDATVWEAARTMHDRGIKRLPVITEEDQLVGIISRADIVRAVARNDDEIRRDVIEHLEVLGEDVFEELEVRVVDGVARLTGKVDRASTHDIALRLTSRVPGVLDVVDHLDHEIDDRRLESPVSGYGGKRRNWQSAEDVGGLR